MEDILNYAPPHQRSFIFTGPAGRDLLATMKEARFDELIDIKVATGFEIEMGAPSSCAA